MSDTDQINGMLLQIKRDELGWAVSDMATSACLSVKQVKQIEQGGISAFYSPTVKLTAAKKMAHILGVSEDELFGRIVPFVPSVSHVEFVAQAETSGLGFKGQTAAPLFRSHDLHELAQPPEHPQEVQDDVNHNEAVSVHLNEVAPESNESNESSGNHLIKIIALFVLAIASAAYFSQQENKVEKTEPPLATPELVPPVAPAVSTEASATPPVTEEQPATPAPQAPSVLPPATTTPAVTVPALTKPATPDTTSKP